jgi:hypothetical protein
MRRSWRIVLALLVLVSATVSSSAEPVDSKADAISMEGFDLQFHRQGPTFGELRQPSFRVHAVTAESDNDMVHWTLRDADAVIIRQSQKELLVSAARGFLDRENEVAVLSDGVRATTGNVIIDLKDLHWDNGTGIARSDNYSEATDGENHIGGNAITIYPDDDVVEMFGGVGTIQVAAKPSADEPEPVKPGSVGARFKYLNVDYDGTAAMNLETGAVAGIRDGVVLELVGYEEADTIKVRARNVDFVYADGDTSSPTAVQLTGDVQLEHASFGGRADEINVNFDSGDVEFRGHAQLTGERFENAAGNLIRYNLDTKDVLLGPGGQIRRLRLFDKEEEQPAGNAEPRS